MEEENAINFHENLAKDWSKKYESGVFLKRISIWKNLIDETTDKGSNWLDLGCGSGVLSKLLADNKANVIALDGSKAMLKEAEKFEYKIKTVLGDITNLSVFQKRFFDGIICSSVIEYDSNQKKIFQEISNVLKNGGLLLISIPLEGLSIRYLQKKIRKFGKIIGKDFFSYLEYSKFELNLNQINEYFNKRGFSIEKKILFNPAPAFKIFNLIKPSMVIIKARKFN